MPYCWTPHSSGSCFRTSGFRNLGKFPAVVSREFRPLLACSASSRGSHELLYFWSPGVSVIFRGLLWPLLALLTVWGLRRHNSSIRSYMYTFTRFGVLYLFILRSRFIFIHVYCIFRDVHMCILNHTYIHTYKAYIHRYICTYVHVHTYLLLHTHTYICIYIHACIHTYIHAYIHTYIHTYIRDATRYDTIQYIHVLRCNC